LNVIPHNVSTNGILIIPKASEVFIIVVFFFFIPFSYSPILLFCSLYIYILVGAHVLSGNVFEPSALNELIPNWKELGAPLETLAKTDNFKILTSETGSFSIPNILVPPQLHNEGNYIISLSQLTRWLAQQAEELGVEIYSGFAAAEVLYTVNKDDGMVSGVRGIATRDAGIAKDGTKKDTYTPGIEIVARQTLFAEGCRGSCSVSKVLRTS
jgi:electron-transferring-flavoprotein dehydrogenase